MKKSLFHGIGEILSLYVHMKHPGILLGEQIKELGRTQKKFAVLAGKKVSEVNELIKGKRNITIQRDYLLHNVLGTKIRYRMDQQIAFDYQNFLGALPSSPDSTSDEEIALLPKISPIPAEKHSDEKSEEKREKETFDMENGTKNLDPSLNKSFSEGQTELSSSQDIQSESSQSSSLSVSDEGSLDPELLQEKIRIFRDF